MCRGRGVREGNPTTLAAATGFLLVFQQSQFPSRHGDIHMASLPSRNNPADGLKYSPVTSDSEANEDASPNNPADSSPAMGQGGAKAKEKEDEEEMVVTNPKLACLIYHSFNVAFVLEVIFFFAHIFIYHRTTHDWWQALLGVAIVSPLFIAPLYVMPVLRDVFVRAYAMAPCDIHGSDGSKPLISEKV